MLRTYNFRNDKHRSVCILFIALSSGTFLYLVEQFFYIIQGIKWSSEQLMLPVLKLRIYYISTMKVTLFYLITESFAKTSFQNRKRSNFVNFHKNQGNLGPVKELNTKNFDRLSWFFEKYSDIHRQTGGDVKDTYFEHLFFKYFKNLK